MPKPVIPPSEASRYLAISRRHPDVWAERTLGIRMWSGMRAVIDAVFHNQRVSVRACHGVSKTYVAALVAVMFFNFYKQCQVITTAPTGRQIKLLLWKEIRDLYKRFPSILRGECMDMEVKDDRTQSRMVGFSTDTQTGFEGQHSPHILWIVDEAKGCPEWLYKAIEGSMTGGDPHVLEISTTDGADQQSPLRAHSTSAKWKSIRLSAFDSPFVPADAFPEFVQYRNQDLYRYGKPSTGSEWPLSLADSIQIATPAWIDDRREWIDTDLPTWETKVCGDFGSQDVDSIIPIDWIMSAVDAQVSRDASRIEYGEDIGERGIDATIQIKRMGGYVDWIKKWNEPDTMVTTGYLIRNAADAPGIHKVDMIGVGSGVFSRLAEQGEPVIGIDSAKDSFFPKEYFNFRAELWGYVRELFKQQYKYGGTLHIPNDPELIEDLSDMKWKTHSSGRRLVEDKNNFRKRHGGRSPNKGDAFVYAFAPIDYKEEG